LLCSPRGSLEEIGTVELEGGKQYQLLVRYQYISKAGQSAGTPFSDHRGGVRFGVAPSKTIEEFISEAVAVAKSVDVVLLFVGLNGGG
jgi:beta-glucosidase